MTKGTTHKHNKVEEGVMFVTVSLTRICPETLYIYLFKNFYFKDPDT